MKAVPFLQVVLRRMRSAELNEAKLAVMLALAQEGRPLRPMELVDATGCTRQVIYEAVKELEGSSLRVERPNRYKTLVTLTDEGVRVLVFLVGIQASDGQAG